MGTQIAPDTGWVLDGHERMREAAIVAVEPAAPVEEAPQRRRKRPFKILTISPNDDGRSLVVSLDVPPCLQPPGPPGNWPVADVYAHVHGSAVS